MECGHFRMACRHRRSRSWKVLSRQNRPDERLAVHLLQQKHDGKLRVGVNDFRVRGQTKLSELIPKHRNCPRVDKTQECLDESVFGGTLGAEESVQRILRKREHVSGTLRGVAVKQPNLQRHLVKS